MLEKGIGQRRACLRGSEVSYSVYTRYTYNKQCAQQGLVLSLCRAGSLKLEVSTQKLHRHPTPLDLLLTGSEASS